MKSTIYVKGKIGLSEYSDIDVFKGYPLIKLDGVNYITDKTEQEVYNDIENIRIRVIKNCFKRSKD